MSDALTETSPGRDGSHNTTTGGTATERLAALEAAHDAAVDARTAARYALREKRGEAITLVTDGLVAYASAIEHRKPSATPEADRPARERELTDAALDVIKERGFVIKAVDTPDRGRVIEVLDPTISAEFDATDAEVLRAERAVAAFKRDHADDLEAERKAADADRIKAALDSNDGDEIRKVLAPTLPAPAAASRPGVHRTHAVIGR